MVSKSSVGKYLQNNISKIEDSRLAKFCKWVNANGEHLDELYTNFLSDTNTDPFKFSIIDFQEEMYFLYCEQGELF